nr:hypothetical protein [Paludibacteraceae bacterium]
KQLEKSQKWLSKQNGFYYSNGLFYDNYHHQRIDVSTPYYFTTHHKTETKKEEVMKQYRKDVAKLSDDFDIENTVSGLKQNAEKLTDNGIELPILAPTFMQKLRREYVHSFDTLDDFKTDMKPVFDEYRAETLHAEKEKQKLIQEEKDLEAFRQQMEEQQRKHEAEYELEMKLRREASQQLRQQSWANEPQQEKKPKKDNDHDLSM